MFNCNIYCSLSLIICSSFFFWPLNLLDLMVDCDCAGGPLGRSGEGDEVLAKKLLGKKIIAVMKDLYILYHDTKWSSTSPKDLAMQAYAAGGKAPPTDSSWPPLLVATLRHDLKQRP